MTQGYRKGSPHLFPAHLGTSQTILTWETTVARSTLRQRGRRDRESGPSFPHTSQSAQRSSCVHPPLLLPPATLVFCQTLTSRPALPFCKRLPLPSVILGAWGQEEEMPPLPKVMVGDKKKKA